MTREEFMKLASAIMSYYPRDNFLPTDESKELWYAELKDIDYAQASLALRKYVQTNRFSPTIADIRGAVSEAITDFEGWSKGWEELRMAIRKFGYMQESLALDSLDPITRETTRRLGWKEICESESDQEQTLRANFRMIYEQVENKTKEKRSMSPEIVDSIEKIRIRGISKVLLGEQE